VFIDPFGPKGVPFSAVSSILCSPCSEVLINFDADGIARIVHAQSEGGNEALLTEVFGDDQWKMFSVEDQTFSALCRSLLDLYKAKLAKISGVRYIFSFEMRSQKSALNYFLVFASQHYRGLEKMKEAMRTMDQTGDYQFADTRVNQPTLMRFDNPSVYRQDLFQSFSGKRATYNELRDFTLNNTAFINPKAMLRLLEFESRIIVKSSDPHRRRGTFNEAKIEYIEFL